MCITLKWQVKGQCIDCGQLHNRTSIAWRCWTCNAKVRAFRVQFTSYLRRAIKSGLLKQISSLKCVDCGDVAAHWDHRNYLQIEMVDPVCRSCNFKRGPAAWSNYADQQPAKAA